MDVCDAGNVVRRARAFAVLVIAIQLAACVSTRVDPLAEQVPFASLDADEQALWKDAERLERTLQRGDLVYTDPILQDALDRMAMKLLTALGAPRAPVRVRVLLDPALNAFALPNGSVYLHSGLLVRLENDAHLALLLGHELTHVLERHVLLTERARRNRQLAAASIFGPLSLAIAVTGGDPTMAVDLIRLGSEISGILIAIQVAGYGREIESGADRRALAAAASAGYPPGEAVGLYRIALEQSEEDDPSEPYAYASHPLLRERILASEEAARALQTSGAAEQASPREVVPGALRELALADAERELRRGRPDRARPVLERYTAIAPDDPRFAELYARTLQATRDGRADLDEARRQLEQAARIAPDDASLARRLALLHREQSRPEEARVEFARYLLLAPDAPDRAVVEELIRELSVNPTSEESQ